jgi:predicted lipoprotein with Yx(FWY)xxD motif
MKRKSLATLAVTIAVVAFAAVALAAGGSAKNRRQAADGSAVSVNHTSLGQTLVDANGRTLYLFEGDKRNVSTLSAAGRAVWPPFTASGRVKAEGAAQSAKLGTTTRGVKQVTYNGHPLYYYVGDHAPGSTTGQNLKEFGALWFVLSPNGSANTSTASSHATPAAAPPSSSSTPSNGYTY